MAQYTIEDIEIIRQKSGISYEEAVNLLEYHNGSLARALVDLEKNGRLKDAKTGSTSGRNKGKSVFTYLYRMRLKVHKGDIVITNISILFVLFTAMSAFWILMFGLLAAMVLGYRISFDRNSSEFEADSFDNIVKNASTNVKNTVFNVAKDIGMAGNPGASGGEAKTEPQRTESPASGTTPVNVQFPEDGSVEVKEGTDGFYEADIQ